MTIFKTQLKKEEKKDAESVVLPQPLLKDEPSEASRPSPPPVGVILAARRRARLTNTCILISAMMVLAIGIIGGIYIYRHFIRGPYIATCGVRYEHSRRGLQRSGLQRSGLQRGYMEERVEIDRLGYYERIEVPDFDECNKAVVLHEFVKNLTAIVDHSAGHCFIMPLNRREVRPPKDFWDLISKLRSGYYMPDSRIVRHYYKIVKPKVPDVSVFGRYIESECALLDTYRLKKRKRVDHERRRHYGYEHSRQKRAVEGANEIDKPVSYGYFGGEVDSRRTGLVVEVEIQGV